MSFVIKKYRVLVAAAIFVVMICAMLVPVETYAAAASTNGTANKYIPMLMYHNFADSLSWNDRSVTITREKFKEDMEWLGKNGYTPLLPQDIVAILDGTKELPQKPVVITIDDGYESAYKIAFPVLKETNMKATVYLIVKGTDKPSKAEIKKLTWEEMKEMYESGCMDIQSHSYGLHQESFSSSGKIGLRKGLIECEAAYYDRVRPDIEKSIQMIEENVGNKVVSFSYPFGIFEPWAENLLAKEDIRFAVTTLYGPANLNGNLFELRRYAVGDETDLLLLLEPENSTAIYGCR